MNDVATGRAPIGQGHVAIVDGSNDALVVACAGRAIVAPPSPGRLAPGIVVKPALVFA